MPPKRHGKGIKLDSNPPPAELPEDLPDGCPHNLSWRNPQNNKLVLLETTHQGKSGCCWTIVFNRLIAAHLYFHGKVGALLSLSSKHLFANIHEKYSNGFLKHYNGVKQYLKEIGLILERECKCVVGKMGKRDISTEACNKVKDKTFFKILEFVVVEGNEVDEKQLISLLKTHGPIAAHIQVTKAYMQTKKDEIFEGPKDGESVENHIILITGIGTKGKNHYFEYQNSWGSSWGGDGGFGKFKRKISLPRGRQSLVMAYMYPKLLDQVFPVRG